MSAPRLYLISPPQFDAADFAAKLTTALDAVPELTAAFQLRLKSASDDAIAEAVAVLKPIVQARNVAFLLNDRPDLAAKFALDGCHIGQDDMACEAARRVVGADKIIGVTCHNSRHLAMLAGEAGADYVAFGAFYPTQTKQVSHQASPDLLAWWQEIMELPCVAIGGIAPHNAAPLLAAGADFLAVSAAIWDAGDIAAVMRDFAEQIAAPR